MLTQINFKITKFTFLTKYKDNFTNVTELEVQIISFQRRNSRKQRNKIKLFYAKNFTEQNYNIQMNKTSRIQCK